MTARTTKLMLHVERVLPAPRALIFKLHSEPDHLARWWGPRGFRVPSIVVDLRVGGQYRIAMQPPDGDPFFLAGEFRRVEPPAQSTEVGVDQGPFLTEARRALHTQGWTETLDRLYELVVNERPRDS